MSREIDVKALVSHLVRGDGADKCRICMGDTTEGQVYLGDTVMMDGDRPVTLAELLEVITGVEVDLAASLPAHACQPCAASAALAAPFVRLCHASEKKWHDITDYLTQLEAPDRDKSSFVFVGAETVYDMTGSKACKSERQAYNFLKARMRTKKRRGRMQCNAKCPECDKRFTNVASFNVHLRDQRIIMCFKCKEIVPIDAYVNHFRSHNLAAYMCKRCTTVFRCKSKLAEHRSVCKYKGSHVCSECKKCFPTAFRLVQHVASKHSQKVCAACGKKFSKLCFKHHTKNCANSTPLQKIFICDYCSKEYNFKSALKLHIRLTHLFGWQYQCDVCGKKFSNPAHLREHDNTHNRVEDRYVCSICGTKYSTRRGYERHYKRHFNSEGEGTILEPRKRKLRGDKIFMCIICNFSTEYKRTLDNHMKVKHRTVKGLMQNDSEILGY